MSVKVKLLKLFLGNLLVILSFAQVKKLRRVHGNLFIISLAVADLIVGTQTLPIIAVNVYSGSSHSLCAVLL